jgi:hypothetical protein
MRLECKDHEENDLNFVCRPVDLHFIESAPLRFVSEVEIDAPLKHVFKVLEDMESWSRFVRDAVKVEWTSPKPFGVGSTRTVILKGMTSPEQFIARYYFSVGQAVGSKKS